MNDYKVVAGATENTEDKEFEKIEAEVQETLAVIGQEVQEKMKEIKDKEFIEEEEEIMQEVEEYNNQLKEEEREFIKEQEEAMQEVKELNEEYNKSIKELEQERQEGLAEMQENLKEDTEETSVKNSIIITKIADKNFRIIEVADVKGDTAIIMQELSKALLKLAE